MFRLTLSLGQQVKPTFTTWKTFTRPADASAEKYLASYEKKNITVSDGAKDIIGKLDFAAGPDKVDIARATAKELGFNQSTRCDAVFKRAFSLGIWLLPHWVALEIRDTYHDGQPYGEWLFPSTESVTDSVGRPFQFVIGRLGGGALWLRAGSGVSFARHDPENILLFALPRE
jgi:hypothetical protein